MLVDQKIKNGKPTLEEAVERNPTPFLAKFLAFLGVLILIFLGIAYAPMIISGSIIEGPFYMSLTVILGGLSVGLFALVLITIGWAIRALNSIVIATEYQSLLAEHSCKIEATKSLSSDST